MQPQMKPFLKDLQSEMLQTRSNEAFLQGFVKERRFKPDPASNEAFLQGSVKQDASNQLQPQMKPFLKDR